MMITINSGAATLGTPVFGYIVDRTGSYALGWQMLAAAIDRRHYRLGSLAKRAPAGSSATVSPRGLLAFLRC